MSPSAFALMPELAHGAALRGMQPLPAPEGVNIWRLRINPLCDQLSDLLSGLSSSEQERCLAYYRAGDRLRYAVCRVVLRRLLAARLGCQPAAVQIIFNPHGKPQLPPGAGLHFNLSHSGRYALLAISERGPVGVDVEYRYDSGVSSDLQSCLTEDERHYCAMHPQPALSFFQVWSGKEALLKALGLGVAQHLRDVSVVPCARRSYMVSQSLVSAKLQVWQLPVASSYVGAAALLA